MKSKVYDTRPATLDSLKTRVRKETENTGDLSASEEQHCLMFMRVSAV
jgi:hypothetical protein